MIKAVIFDLDGLLIDSQPLQYKAYSQVFLKYGFPISKQEWEDEWIHNSISCNGWVQKNNLPLDFEKMRSEKKKIYERLVLTDLKLKDGANNAINRLLIEYPLCIASASRKSSIDVISNKFDFSSRFQKIISDKESHIDRPKPYPDIFLYVAKVMKILPEECLVIEDSVAGLKAARSANMKCVVCPDSFCKIELSEFKDADRVIKSLNELDVNLAYQLDEENKKLLK